MIAKLNLASQPFRNRALPWSITFVVMAVSVIALIYIVLSTNQTNARTANVMVEVAKLHNEDNQLSEKASELTVELGDTQVMRLQAAQRLIDRKRFSWTNLFNDLERILPQGIRVTRISIRDVASHGNKTTAMLDMTVVGKDPGDVTGMLTAMDKGGVFHAEPMSESVLKGKGEQGTEWVLSISYTQRSVSPSADETARLDTGNKTDAPNEVKQ